MKIMISKAMVKALNAAAKKQNKPMYFNYCECSYLEYKYRVNAFSLSGHDITNNNMVKYISVSYPDNYYAMNNYITFYDLERAFIPGDTIETFTNRIVNNYEI